MVANCRNYNEDTDEEDDDERSEEEESEEDEDEEEENEYKALGHSCEYSDRNLHHIIVGCLKAKIVSKYPELYLGTWVVRVRMRRMLMLQIFCLGWVCYGAPLTSVCFEAMCHSSFT